MISPAAGALCAGAPSFPASRAAASKTANGSAATHRWKVERTLAWFARFRRIVVRYERRADIFEAFHHLAAALITFRFVEKWFC